MPELTMVMSASDAEDAGKCEEYIHSSGMIKRFKSTQEQRDDGTWKITFTGEVTVSNEKFGKMAYECPYGSVDKIEIA